MIAHAMMLTSRDEFIVLIFLLRNIWLHLVFTLVSMLTIPLVM